MVYISIVSPGYFDRLVSVAEQVPSVLSTAAPMLKTVDNVHTVFHLGPRLSQSGFATVFLLPGQPDQVFRIQECTQIREIVDEVRLGQKLEAAGLAPSTIAHYLDRTHHGMLMQRYQMDLQHWFKTSTPTIHRRSLWPMRVRQLLRSMARTGVFCIDLKPANIVINVEDMGIIREMKLIDFGGGLCWESSQLLPDTPHLPWQVVYATLLLVFNASIKHSEPEIYARHGDNGPFAETRLTVAQILDQPLLRHYWSNLFFRVPIDTYTTYFMHLPEPDDGRT